MYFSFYSFGLFSAGLERRNGPSIKRRLRRSDIILTTASRDKMIHLAVKVAAAIGAIVRIRINDSGLSLGSFV